MAWRDRIGVSELNVLVTRAWVMTDLPEDDLGATAWAELFREVLVPATHRTFVALIGPTGRVALDANNAWAYPFEAIRFARMVEPFDPWWLEEPLAVDDIAGHAEVARSLDMPVATGEIHSSRSDFRDLIQAGAADILQPDAAVVGGVSEWMKVAHAAATFGYPVAPHWNHDIHVHMAGSVANCLAVEWFDAEQDIVNFDQLLAEPMRPQDGYLTIPEGPGIGLKLDWDAVERFRVPRAAA